MMLRLLAPLLGATLLSACVADIDTPAPDDGPGGSSKADRIGDYDVHLVTAHVDTVRLDGDQPSFEQIVDVDAVLDADYTWARQTVEIHAPAIDVKNADRWTRATCRIEDAGEGNAATWGFRMWVRNHDGYWWESVDFAGTDTVQLARLSASYDEERESRVYRLAAPYAVSPDGEQLEVEYGRTVVRNAELPDDLRWQVRLFPIPVQDGWDIEGHYSARLSCNFETNPIQ